MRNQKWTPDKWQLQNQANNDENVGTYTYTATSKVKQFNKNTVDWPGEQRK